MSEVRFRRSAQRDVQQAFEYFEGKSPGLGIEFIERVEEAADRIRRNPATYQTVFQDVRRATLRQFRYALFYRIEADGSVVIACLAHRQDLSLAQERTRRGTPRVEAHRRDLPNRRNAGLVRRDARIRYRPCA